MPSVHGLVADGGHDTRGFSRLEDDHDCVGLRPFKIRVDEFVTPALWRVDDRDAALRGSLFHPALKLVGDVAQGIPCYRVKLPIGVEEADHSLRLLERLYQPIQQNAVEAAIVPMDAVLVMLVERVHARLP